MESNHAYFMRRAIALAQQGMEEQAGGPFGAVIVKDGIIIAEGYNCVTSTNDPTAHAEVMAIRKACQKLQNFQLTDCIIYTSCEPCPMCLGAIYWARPKQVFFACHRTDAAAIDFDDQLIYEELEQPHTERTIPFTPFMRADALPIFEAWAVKQDKKEY